MTDEKTGSKSCGGGFLLPAIIVIIILIILVVISRPSLNRSSHKAKDAEVKANLHSIQISIERWAVDSGGTYPPYLIGGEPRYARSVNSVAKSNAFSDIAECASIEMVSDPLMRDGYLNAYPRNPFARDGRDIHKLQDALASSIKGNDPLRNGAPEAAQLGTRFGPYCTTMGQVLCDPRVEKRDYTDPVTGEIQRLDTWAIVEYEFWDVWQGSKSSQFLPGQFFYKGLGPQISFLGLVAPPGNDQLTLEGDRLHPAAAIEYDQYILAGYGDPRTMGKDIIGEEGAIYPAVKTGSGQTAAWETWTRSEYSAKSKMGSPYSFSINPSGQTVTAYGNPNGIRDSIILALTAGEDYIGDR